MTTSQDQLNLLLVEDRKDDVYFVQRALKNTDLDIELVVATTAKEAEDRIFVDGESFDALLIDYSLPGKDGLQLAQTLIEEGITAPIIFLTGMGNEEVAVEAIRLGAYNYLVKDSDLRYLRQLHVEVLDALNRKAEKQQYRQMTLARQSIVEHAIDAIISIDSQNKIIEFNPAAERIFGFDRAEILGKSLDKTIIPEKYRDAHCKKMAALQAGGALTLQGRRIRLEALRSNGEVFPIELSLLADDQQNPITYTAFIRDMTEETRAKEELAWHQRLLKEATNRTNLSAWIWDNDAREMEYIAPEIGAVLGTELAEIFPDCDSFCDRVHEQERESVKEIYRALADGKAGQRDYYVQYRVVDSGGHQRWIEEHIRKEPLSASQPHLFVGTLQNISERKEVESRFQRSQHLGALGQLTGGVAHDFNNLLAVINGNLELLYEKLHNDISAMENIEPALRATDLGTDLVQRLLSFARQRRMHPTKVELNEKLQGLKKLLSRTMGADYELILDCEQLPIMVEVDSSQLEDALLNLILNARDAMPDGGSITLKSRIGKAPASNGAVNLASGVKMAVVTVADEGEGMEETARLKAFEPFFTTKSGGKGSGLGLSMVYGFVKQSGGHIELDSAVGSGTSVKLYFPLLDDEHQQPASAKPEEVKLGTGDLVLVVEDDQDVRALVMTLVESLGYEVLVAGGSDETLEIVSAYPQIQLIISDIILASGERGPDIARKAQDVRPGLKVIFMSGYAPDSVMPESELLRTNGFLRKPFKRAELASAIDDALSKRV